MNFDQSSEVRKNDFAAILTIQSVNVQFKEAG